MSRRNMRERRELRVMRAREEAFGLTISSALRDALATGDAKAIATAIHRDLRAGARLPRLVVAAYELGMRDGPPAAWSDLARSARDVLVNCEVEGASAPGGV